MKETLIHSIEEVLRDLDISGVVPHLEFPGELSHGDYSTNVALASSKVVGKNPKELAEEIASLLRQKNIPNISAIEIAGPGFINFFLSQEYFKKTVEEIISDKDSYGKSDIHKGKSILIEHSSPNLFKPFHIGHVMNNAIGESITRLARFSGADVTVISYPSDVSLGIGKAVWALMDGGVSKLESFSTQEEKLAYLGECYVRGTRALEDDLSLESRMREITKILYDKTPSPEYDVYQIGKDINLSYFKSITERLGSNFDEYIYESEAGVEGESLVRNNIGPIFEESEGAVIYRGEQDGLHSRVFINKEGYPTYEAKDTGLLSLKFKRYNPDISLFVTDHQQSEYFKVVVTAAGKINPIWKERTIHRTHGRMTFKGQKMSSRLGGVPIASTLVDTLQEDVREKSPDTPTDRADIIGISALKFAILRATTGKDINFDPDTSLSFEGDSGPYLQYTVVRARSILAKAQEVLGKKPSADKPLAGPTDIEKYLVRFPSIVEQSISAWEPHVTAVYLLELAQLFNTWYSQVRIVDENNTDIEYHLALVSSVATVLENGLFILGIKVPEKM